MAKPLNILFVSSEVEPFAKTGGLGEVSRALPQMVREMKHEIRIMMPRYGFISDRRFLLHDVLRLREIPIPTAYDTKIGSVNSSFVNSIKTKVQVYFLANKEYFGSRQGLYVNPKSNKEYVDNDERFIFFCRGVLETLKLLGWQPDIIHCNDWQTGLIPVYLKTLYKDDEFFKNIKTVFTIHNLAYQGIFPQASFLKTGLPQEVFGINGVEFYGKMNCMKAGLLYSDIITTVSEKYAKEICSSEDYGCGLEGILHKRKSNLYGILNGIDEELWNPETDKFITQRYDSDSIEGKQENKRELLSKFGLEYQEGVPLIGMVSRLVDQKGIDLIKEISDKFMKMDIQLIVLGTGEERYQDFFAKLRKKYPKKVGVEFTFNEELAHLIEAGSDMYLMPSRYEPCGLNQMYSLKYGTIPIVRATGGLDDTIIDAAKPNGNGFKFSKYDGKELLKTIQQAIKTYENPTKWMKLIKNGMSADFSWKSSAEKYIDLYQKLLK